MFNDSELKRIETLMERIEHDLSEGNREELQIRKRAEDRMESIKRDMERDLDRSHRERQNKERELEKARNDRTRRQNQLQEEFSRANKR